MILAANFSYWKWRKLLPLLMVLNFLLLLMVFIPGLGIEVNEAKRWIGIGGFTLQPSELSKLVVVIFSASFLSKKNLNMTNFWQSSFIPLAFMGLSFLLIFFQPDRYRPCSCCRDRCYIYCRYSFKVFSLIIAALPVVAYHKRPYRMQRIFSFWTP